MDRLHALEVFAAVADAGSLAGAARRLHMSPPAVTRALAALEERIGVRLFNRTTRSLNLTEAGAGFLDTARRVLADLNEAENAAAGQTSNPSGHLTVSASVTFGRSHVAGILMEFLRAERGVTASLLLLDRLVNLVEEAVDVAVRIAHLRDSTLIARRVGTVRRILVASPEYLAQRGTPATPQDLKTHDVIAFSGLLPGREWRFMMHGRAASIALAPRLEVNDATAAIAGAERGYGITVALSYMVQGALAERRLVPVLDSYTPPPVPVQLVYPQGRGMAAKLRAFLDFAAPRLKDALAADAIPQTESRLRSRTQASLPDAG
jgi:DNA-binding transcriptional LysR family regulator